MSNLTVQAIQRLDERLRKLEVKRDPIRSAIAEYLNLPQLRGFWPTSSAALNISDLSGQSRTLTNNNNATFDVYNNLQPYTALDGVNQYYSRVDESGLKVINGWTAFAWFRPTALTARMGIMSKGATNNTLTFTIECRGDIAGDPVLARVGTGAGIVSAISTNFTTLNKWHFIAGRFVSSISVDAWLDNVKTSQTVGVPATSSNNADQMEIGNVLTLFPFSGDITLCALCAIAVSDEQIQHIYKLSAPLFSL